MSAASGPKIFSITRDELAEMMQVNHASLTVCVKQLEEAVAKEENEVVKESLQLWQRQLARDEDETRFMLEHLDAEPLHRLTGTELIALGRTFREVAIDVGKLRLAPPPVMNTEMAERRLANTVAAVPRASVPDFLVGPKRH